VLLHHAMVRKITEGLVLAVALPCSNALRLPNAISSNMVLQRAPLAPRLWGFANTSEVISVTIGEQSVSTQPDADGNWVLELPMQHASTGRTISISSSSGETQTLSNIAFGDVYLCSGQSNMEFSTNDAFNATQEIEDSINYPDLRLYTIKDTPANSPQLDGVSKADYQWGVSSPASFVPVGGNGMSYFSATCYFFGRDLYKALGGDVPIGLVASDWGGQRVEAFSSPDAMADTTCGGTQEPTEGPVPNPGTSQLWYGQIYPFLNMRFTGATWYQGEANVDDPDSYACRFPAMIVDWRKKFQLPDLSFFFVQLAAYSQDYSEIRAAQMAALQLPKTGYAVAIDLGDPSSPQGSIHPRRKQEVGRRLALACQRVQYGMDVVATGPVFESYEIDGHHIAISFAQDTSEGLHLAGTAACGACCSESPLEVQIIEGAEVNQWQRTEMLTVTGHTATAQVSLVEGQSIGGLRFNWEGYPQCSLYNGLGGPDDHTGVAASPFKPFSTPSPPIPYDPTGASIPSKFARDLDITQHWTSGGASIINGPKDNATSGIGCIRTGRPGEVPVIRFHSGVIGKGHLIDNVSVSFRYACGWEPKEGEVKKASTVRVLLVDADGKELKTLLTTQPLGDYSAGTFTQYSPPISVNATGLQLANDELVFVALEVTNNEQNLHIPIDDLASGFNVNVEWIESNVVLV